MADIELVIKIPEEVKQAFDCAESNDLKGCYYDHGGVIGNAIKNGTPLSEHHGNLIDRKELKKKAYIIQDWMGGLSSIVEKFSIDNAPTIIPATEEVKHYPQVDGITPSVIATEDFKTCANQDVIKCCVDCSKLNTRNCLDYEACIQNDHSDFDPATKEGDGE